MRTACLFSMFCAIILLCACSEDSSSTDIFEEQSKQITSPYVVEKSKLPEIVHRLFYAVKDSLDYASVTGGINGKLEDIPDDPPPKESLEEYERVTNSLLEEVNRSFIIERYSSEKWNYELIVQARKDKEERYKATRIQMFRFDEGEWKPLGVYLHW